MRHLAVVSVVCFLIAFFMHPIAAIAADAASAPVVDKDYIKEHYPEVYRQIYEDGKASGTVISAPESKPDDSVKAAAVNDNASPEAVAAAKTQPPPDDNWWERLSITSNPTPEHLLFHVEADFTPIYKWGNTEGYNINGQGTAVLRYKRLTDSLNYQIQQKLTKDVGGATSNDDYQTFQESIQYDLTDKLYSQVGYIWERDRVNIIKHRHIGYAGIGYYPFNTPLHKLEFFLSGGYQMEVYYNTIQQSLNFSKDSLPVIYAYENYKINITKSLFYNEIFRIIQNMSARPVYFADASGNYVAGDMVHRYRWTMINALGFNLNKHMSIVASHKIDYDNNPWPTVLGTDNVFKLSFRISY